jgi:hypothetical protein
MGDDEHGHALAGEIGHDGQDLVDHLRVERRGGLVEEQSVRLHRQRPSDGHALLLAAGQLTRVLGRLVGDTDPFEQFSPAPLRDGPGLPTHLDRTEGDLVEHRLVAEQG